MLSKSNCLVAQSGGPTVVINASLAGVISKALASDKIQTIYGSLNGIQGVLDENFINLTAAFENNTSKLELLKTTPAMYLGSCRYKLPAFTENKSDYIAIFNTFKAFDIKYFFYIGGNDSMDTVSKLSNYAKAINSDISIIGIPKTIDNDLQHIDHTPGFGSAAKYIASSILEIAYDAYIYASSSVTIVEIMGRNAGWLTAASALARTQTSDAPHLIYLPEKPFSTGEFLSDVKDELLQRKHVIIAVSEGIKDTAGSYISAQSPKEDQFGHAILNGAGKYLESLIQNAIGCKVRSIELNVLQRCQAHIASLTDQEEAFELGSYAVTTALKGESCKMVSLERTSNSPYTVQYSSVSIDEVANFEKTVPLEWISCTGNDVTSELIEYVSPLIKGESPVSYKNGLPEYMPIAHLTNIV